VLKKCKKPDDVLFINAAEHFVKGKRQNQLTDEHIAKIIDTYQFRKEEPATPAGWRWPRSRRTTST
jgi:type I restriction enzyme M protein